jgi:uncharacterized phage-associated protein
MNKPANVFDVAQYILSGSGRLTTWKLQKLCYYSQAWSLVWDDAPLFKETIEAWASGPVVPALYKMHRGQFYVSDVGGNPNRLTVVQRETIDAVLKTYGNKPSQWLRELTHREEPWRNARRRANLSLGERGNSVITLDDLAEYYEGLCDKNEKAQVQE